MPQGAWYSDARWLIDDAFDPLGLNDDSDTQSRKRRRASALVAWLYSDFSLHDNRPAPIIRLPRDESTCSYTGDLLQCVDNVHPDISRSWHSYPTD
jgi:hypothetical protein